MSNPSVTEWLTITQSGKLGWMRFYEALLHQPISNPTKFFAAVDTFGHALMFESVYAASTKTFTEDCLNYVLAIASRKLSEEINDITESDRYRMNLERAKQRMRMQNEELENKIEKARKLDEQ